MKVFVSYSHAQGEWVLDRLVPCLKAGGAGVLIDVERFRAGGGVHRQMDATQDQADRHVLVLSAAYLADPPPHRLDLRRQPRHHRTDARALDLLPGQRPHHRGRYYVATTPKIALADDISPP